MLDSLILYTLPSTPIEPRLQHVESSKLLLGIAPQFLFISTFSCEIYAPASQVEYRMGLGVISLVTLIAFIRYEIIILPDNMLQYHTSMILFCCNFEDGSTDIHILIFRYTD